MRTHEQTAFLARQRLLKEILKATNRLPVAHFFEFLYHKEIELEKLPKQQQTLYGVSLIQQSTNEPPVIKGPFSDWDQAFLYARRMTKTNIGFGKRWTYQIVKIKPVE
jgi:hypothetical protein